MNQAFINGFVKRAEECGVHKNAAVLPALWRMLRGVKNTKTTAAVAGLASGLPIGLYAKDKFKDSVDALTGNNGAIQSANAATKDLADAVRQLNVNPNTPNVANSGILGNLDKSLDTVKGSLANPWIKYPAIAASVLTPLWMLQSAYDRKREVDTKKKTNDVLEKLLTQPR